MTELLCGRENVQWADASFIQIVEYHTLRHVKRTAPQNLRPVELAKCIDACLDSDPDKRLDIQKVLSIVSLLDTYELRVDDDEGNEKALPQPAPAATTVVGSAKSPPSSSSSPVAVRAASVKTAGTQQSLSSPVTARVPSVIPSQPAGAASRVTARVPSVISSKPNAVVGPTSGNVIKSSNPSSKPGAHMCDECESQAADIRCEKCNQSLCADCAANLHRTGSRQSHVLTPFKKQVACENECGNKSATSWCEACQQYLCANCKEYLHRAGRRQKHVVVDL